VAKVDFRKIDGFTKSENFCVVLIPLPC